MFLFFIMRNDEKDIDRDFTVLFCTKFFYFCRCIG
ncbi:hypothetical protein CUP0039 [Campylobacter upsaliensis RM3195]|nr:hypothetical protein CUP0039 [Campylobacter upsaliensis RM3195]